MSKPKRVLQIINGLQEFPHFIHYAIIYFVIFSFIYKILE